LINYLPAPLAHKAARLSDRVGDETWEELLRIEDSDLAGLTFYVAEPEQTRITVDGRDAVGVKSKTRPYGEAEHHTAVVCAGVPRL
jgi:hypothetical protein